jgi:hypothetical protein
MPSTGQTIRIERAPETAATADAPPATYEPVTAQERETILRMVAEGRITPEEGDMLLDALE